MIWVEDELVETQCSIQKKNKAEILEAKLKILKIRPDDYEGVDSNFFLSMKETARGSDMTSTIKMINDGH